MYGEGDDDLFDLSKVGDDAKDIYVKDYGVGNDKIELNNKYKGMYRLDKKDDGSVNLVLDNKLTGTDNIVIANIRGSKLEDLNDSGDPLNDTDFFTYKDENNDNEK